MEAQLMEEERVAFACSVRHRSHDGGTGRSRGRDRFHLPDITNIRNTRVELVVAGEVWSALGARLEGDASDDGVFTVEWWFSGGHAVSYALVVYANEAPIDVDRFIEIDGSEGHNITREFGTWTFTSESTLSS